MHASPSTDLHLTDAGPESWPGTAAMLARAFADDPVARHVFPDAARRGPGMEHIFRVGIRHAARHGRVDLLPPARAVAVWVRTSRSAPGWWPMLRAGFLAAALHAGWEATRRMLRYERFVEVRRGRWAGGWHWYLFAIGVDPAERGRGHGGALLRHGLERARSEGLPCLLETSNPANLDFYTRHGFRVAGEDRLPGTDLMVWSLRAD